MTRIPVDLARDLTSPAWRRAMEAVEAALDHAAGARLDWLRRSAGLSLPEVAIAEELLGHCMRIEECDATAGGAAPTFAMLPALLDGVGSEDPRLVPGDRVGRFVVERFIASGGMGEVYACRDGALGQPVAVKTLPRHAGVMRERRLEREAAAMARLEHPHIARLVDWGLVSRDGREAGYLAMELVEGEPLEHACARLRGTGPVDPWPIVGMLLPVVDAVAHAHARGVIHRDIKPSNILVDRQGRARLLDFGVALMLDRDVAASRTITEDLARPGTLAYMSPEQVSGADARGTTRSDVRALALVMLESINGERAVRTDGMGLAEVIDQVVRVDPPPLRTGRGGRDASLAAVLRKALRADPSSRYQSAAEFADDLRRVRDGLAPAGVPLRGFESLRGFVRRRRRGLALAGIASLAAIAALAAVATQYLRARDAETRVELMVSDLVDGSAPIVTGLQQRLLAANEPLSARVAAAESALEYLDWLERRSGGDPRVLAAVARSLRQLAASTGAGGGASLGETASAVAMTRRAIGILDGLIAVRQSSELREERGRCWSLLGTTLPWEERAEQMARASDDIGMAAALAAEPTRRRQLQADAAMLRAYSAVAREDLESLRSADEALRAVAGPDADGALLGQVGMVDRMLADLLLGTGDAEGARSVARAGAAAIGRSIELGDAGFSNQRHLAHLEMTLAALESPDARTAMGALESALARSRRTLDERPGDNFRRVSHLEAVSVFARHARRLADSGWPEVVPWAVERIAAERRALAELPPGTVPHAREALHEAAIDRELAGMRRATPGDP